MNSRLFEGDSFFNSSNTRFLNPKPFLMIDFEAPNLLNLTPKVYNGLIQKDGIIMIVQIYSI